MRAVVKAAKVVTTVSQPPATDPPGLTPDQLLLFAKWVTENPQVNTMIRVANDRVPDTVDSDRFRLLEACWHCGMQHSPALMWCPASLGMSPLAPLMEGPGCERSQCNTACSCAIRAYNKEFEVRMHHRAESYKHQREDFEMAIVQFASQVTREMIHGGIVTFLPETLPSILPVSIVEPRIPLFNVGDCVEFELPDRAFAYYAFGQVRSTTFAPLYAIVTPSGNYYTIAGKKIRVRDTEEYLSVLLGDAPPIYVVGDLVKAMLPDRVCNTPVNARVTEVVEGVSYGVLSFHGNHFYVFEQDIRLMTDQDLVDLCEGRPELAQTRRVIEEHTFGAEQIELFLSSYEFRSSEILAAEERLLTQVAPDTPGLINGPETYRLPVPYRFPRSLTRHSG